MGASRTEAFFTRSCPFSSPSSSFTSRNSPSWTKNVSRSVSENDWKRSDWHSRKMPVRPREPRVAAVSDFSGTVERIPAGRLKTARCAAVRERGKKCAYCQERQWGKPLAASIRGCVNGQNRAILDAATRKQDKELASKLTLLLLTTARSADCIKRLRRRCDWRLFGEK